MEQRKRKRLLPSSCEGRRIQEQGCYKLLQISKKYRLIKSGNIVVDLGAFPGGWMQAARTIVGEEGYVLGVDLER